MMKRLFITGCVIALAALFADAASAFAQSRMPKPRQDVDRPGKIDPRFERIPNQRKGLDRPPIADPDFNRARRRGLGQEQKRRLQQQLMQAIGLTDYQRARMADIRRGHEDVLIAAGRRLRQAKQSLDYAIMSEQYDEALIRQRTEELAQAQADMVRLQTRVRAQVRSVLTSDQVTRFNELERRLRRQMREQRENQLQGNNQSANEPPAPPDLEEVDLISLLLFSD